MLDAPLTVTISPLDVNVDTFSFGIPGADAPRSGRGRTRRGAHISVDCDIDAYALEVSATDGGHPVQSAGHVVAFSAAEATVRCAVREIRSHLGRRERGS
jgi:hypothetical protein